jgi:hypothetical protein
MTTLAEDDPRLVFIPIEVAIIPPGGIIMHMKDRWWAKHPEKGLIFWKPNKRHPHPGAPQCNSSEAMTKRLWELMYPWAEIVFVPSVFYKIDPHDY